MGRILVVIGVLMLAASVIVPFAGSFSFLNEVRRTEEVAVPADPNLCNDGERLETDSGPSGRTSTSDFTTGRTVLYYCVNDAGERRDISGTVYSGLLTETSSILGGVGSMLTSGLAATGLSVGGVALIIVGVLMTVRTRPRAVDRYGLPGTRSNLGGGNSPVVGSPFSDSPVGVAPPRANPTQTPPNAGGMQGNVVDFVRDQLDTAYRNGQITREDYDRAIEKLNRQ